MPGLEIVYASRSANIWSSNDESNPRRRQYAQWNAHGYLLLPRHLSARRDVRRSSRWVDELAAWPEAPGKWMKWYEQARGRRQLCRVEDFLPYHADFAEFLESAALIAACSSICSASRRRCSRRRSTSSSPGGAGFAPHQDAPAFTTFGQRYHVTLMVSVDPVDARKRLPRSRRRLPRPGPLAASAGRHARARLGRRPDLEADRDRSPATLLFFDSYVPHRSGPNRSERPRRALYVTYNRASDGDAPRRVLRAESARRSRPSASARPGADYSAAAAVYNLGNPIR